MKLNKKLTKFLKLRKIKSSRYATSSEGSFLSRKKNMVGSGHVAPIFSVLANKINAEDVLKINSCSYLA